ncbi:beta-lactamase hydrolase domain-containing protein [Sphingosinithalassobacter sp. LHW66-3]|uniref:beta-lactamase hydrolase domain-containing protein n=1 Tax=Sphingosinithalassobacter sp. LHW66-3 TaxID=3424718 RepID=UPI003D6C3C27
MERAQIEDNLSLLTFPPAAHDLQSLADAGFKSIVNLRQAGEQGEKLSPQAEAEEARESGLEYLHYPVSPRDLTAENAKDFTARLEQLPAPVAIHCAGGRRASLMGLASWALQNGRDAATAAKRGRDFGLEISEDDLSPLLDVSGADAR